MWQPRLRTHQNLHPLGSVLPPQALRPAARLALCPEVLPTQSPAQSKARPTASGAENLGLGDGPGPFGLRPLGSIIQVFFCPLVRSGPLCQDLLEQLGLIRQVTVDACVAERQS